MGYDRRVMVKQRLGEIPANDTHPRLAVYTSGEDGWYVFRPMDQNGCEGTLDIPVKGSDLKPGWRRRLT